MTPRCGTWKTWNAGSSPLEPDITIVCPTPGRCSGGWYWTRGVGGGGRIVYTSFAPLLLPSGIRNPRIRSFMSGAFDRPIPATVPPITKTEEKTIISTIFTELHKKFCVGLENPPSFSRSILAQTTVHSTGRTDLLGGSNLGKMKAAAESGTIIVYLTSSWSPRPGNIKKIAEVLKSLSPKPGDTIIIEAMSNKQCLLRH